MAINQAITQVYIRPVQGEGVAEMWTIVQPEQAARHPLA